MPSFRNWRDMPGVVAVATDQTLDRPLPQLDLNDHAAIAAFVLEHTGLR
jgi:molybdopterin-guanine dinucleotide biosynthesis adapter protein